MYMRAQRSGFELLPITKLKASQYALIFGAGYFAYVMAHNVVRSITGDDKAHNYMRHNRLPIVYGGASMD